MSPSDESQPQPALTPIAKERILNAVLSGLGVYFESVALLVFLTKIVAATRESRSIFLMIMVISGLLCFLAVRFKTETKVNCLVVLISTLISVYMVEIVLFTILTPSGQEGTRRDAVPMPSLNKLEELQRLRDKGIDAWPAVLPCHWLQAKRNAGEDPQTLPLSGLSNKYTLFCNETGTYESYTSDEHGFNNPSGSWVNQPDLVLIGDSFAHGECVGVSDSIAGNLRKSGKQVVNLGLGGSGPLIEYAVLREFAAQLKPKAVLWIYFEGNDINFDLPEEEQSTLLMTYVNNPSFSQNMLMRQPEVDQWWQDFISGKKTEKEIHLNESVWKKHGRTFMELVTFTNLRTSVPLFFKRKLADPTDNFPSESLELFKKILKQSQEQVTGWNGKLYFVYLPTYKRYVAPQANPAPLGNFSKPRVLSIVKSLNIPIIDIQEEVFARHPDPAALFPLRRFGHYTAEGYQLTAIAIAHHLSEPR